MGSEAVRRQINARWWCSVGTLARWSCSNLCWVLVCWTLLGGAVWAEGEGPLEFPRFPPTPPAEARSTFETQPGFDIELVASEPLVS